MPIYIYKGCTIATETPVRGHVVLVFGTNDQHAVNVAHGEKWPPHLEDSTEWPSQAAGQPATTRVFAIHMTAEIREDLARLCPAVPSHVSLHEVQVRLENMLPGLAEAIADAVECDAPEIIVTRVSDVRRSVRAAQDYITRTIEKPGATG